MGKALYREYRPKSLQEVVGQEHITDTLEQALKQGRISHAYLFTGPKGVGKTSVARILAHEINNLPYSDESAHIDIIEIDAASNRRIDEIRELREKVYVSPVSARYKVYIIDEVHMLTREAFNALLKTLEEPPGHVVFILATTDAHKLPETIVSRTQRFTFKPVEKSKVAAHLKEIAAKEKIKVEDEALELLAEHGEGSFRDSISLLDQSHNLHQTLTAEAVRNLLGIPPDDNLKALMKATEHGDLLDVSQRLSALYQQGFQAATLARQLGQAWRADLLDGKQGLPTEQLLELLGRLIEVPASHQPERALEIVLLAAAPGNSVGPAAVSPPKTDSGVATKVHHESVKVKQPTKAAEAPKTDSPALTLKPLDDQIWQEVLAQLKKHHNTLYGVVRMAQPAFTEGKLQLTFAFDFHRKRLNDARNQQKLAEIIKQLSGQNIKIDCVLDKELAKTTPKPAVEPSDEPVADSPLSTISNIFGGAELLE